MQRFGPTCDWLIEENVRCEAIAKQRPRIGDRVIDMPDLCKKHINAVAPVMVGIALGLVEVDVLRSLVYREVPKRPDPEQKVVRQWCREQGYEVHPAGRLPNRYIEEYKQATGWYDVA